MRKFTVLAIALLLAVSVGSAAAGEMEGKVQSYDSGERMLIMHDGTKVWLSEGLAVEGLKEGSVVKVVFEERDGKAIVTKIEIAN